MFPDGQGPHIYIYKKYIYKYSYNTKAEQRVMHSLGVVMHASGVIGIQNAKRLDPRMTLTRHIHTRRNAPR